MRVERNRSRLTFRKQRRRRGGCLSLTVLLGVLASIAAFSWSIFGSALRTAAPGAARSGQIAGAQQAFDRGDLDTAIRLARQLLIETPNHADALALLTRALIYRSYSDYNHAADRQSAVQITAEAVAFDPSDPRLQAAQAYALQAAGQPVTAAEIARRVLQSQPDNGMARLALALAYGSVGSFESALRETQRALEQPEWALDGLRALAISYSDLGDYRSAVQAVERALALHNRLLPLYFERALYALQLGDADAATAAYFQVLAYDPANIKARLRLCELSSLLREREAALDYCGQVTERAPDWADGWYQLGREYFLQGDFRAAQAALHRCSSLQVMQNVPVSERRFECWYLQGQAAEILGDCPSLLATYNEFRAMAADAAVRQTWVYPPEGPPGCATPTGG